MVKANPTLSAKALERIRRHRQAVMVVAKMTGRREPAACHLRRRAHATRLHHEKRDYPEAGEAE
jgi:hypothetical protein